MLYVGIDCSKSTFDIALPQTKGYRTEKFDNQESGFESFLALLPQGGHCVMEATGPYFCRLATFLHRKQVPVSVVNPLVIKRFAQMRLVRTKTDKADAITIAQYGKAEMPALWQPVPEHLLQVQQEMTLAEQLL